jgi:diaminopimelate epimerase
VRFEKWQALGNDYLIIEQQDLPFELTPARVRRLCQGHFGVFADGVLLLSAPADATNVADLRIFNPDGSEAELSGNGAREAILYLRRRGWTDRDSFSIHTAAGEIRPQITGHETCRVDMGRARMRSRDFPEGPEDGRGVVRAGGRDWAFRHISIGNPQCAIRVDSPSELEALDLAAIGPSIEAEARFPNRTNVSWYAGLGAAVAHALEQDRHPGQVRVTVVLDGGELEVEVGEDLQINLTGWARPVFEGRLSEEFEKELHETE